VVIRRSYREEGEKEVDIDGGGGIIWERITVYNLRSVYEV